MTYHFVLPKPPSVNTLYRRGQHSGLYMTARGRDYIEECAWKIKTIYGTPETFKENVSVSVHLFTCRHQDIDNIFKITLDLLAKHVGLIADDSQVVELHGYKHKVNKLVLEQIIIDLESK